MTGPKTPLRTIDLYAGAGGISLGFQGAQFKHLRFEIVAAFDNWKPAIETLKKNFKSTEIVKMDFDTYKGDKTVFTKFAPDMIIGGPPCQDFSHAGKRNEDLGRGKLTVTFAEIIIDVRPKWFVMENVDRILKTQKYKLVKAAFKKSSYGITEKVLDASLCGVPQKRKRYFMIGELEGIDDALLPYLEKALASKPMTLRDYFGNNLCVEYYYRHPRNYERRAIFSIYEPSPTIRGVNRPIPSTYQKHPGDAVEPSEKVRPLTTLERSYIQTFPKGYVFEGSKTEKEQMIGNAVPVKLAECVAKCILNYIFDSARVKQKRIDSCLENTLPKSLVLSDPLKDRT
jgi:DNA (cytosine-5)-methyltransferase 1